MALEKNFENVFSGMAYNYGKLEAIVAELYQHLQKNPDDAMAQDLFTRLSTIAENMVFSQKEFTTFYGDPSIKDNLIENLDSKVVALHEAQEKLNNRNL